MGAMWADFLVLDKTILEKLWPPERSVAIVKRGEDGFTCVCLGERWLEKGDIS
jgi:hypothetical protein